MSGNPLGSGATPAAFWAASRVAATISKVDDIMRGAELLIFAASRTTSSPSTPRMLSFFAPTFVPAATYAFRQSQLSRA
jgi:hypothetical protein